MRLPALPSFLSKALPSLIKPAPARRPSKIGRPKGSKNRPKSAASASPSPAVQTPEKDSGKDYLPSPAAPEAIGLTDSADASLGSAAPSPALPQVSLGAVPDSLTSSEAAAGGEGGNQAPTAGNLDKTPARVEILQSSESSGGVVEVAAVEEQVEGGEDTSRTPCREVEGILQSSQANGENKKEVLEGWMQEGVIGEQCRNKWYVEVCVDGAWGKCAKSGMNLFKGEKVKVKEVWRSADGLDVEWEVIERVEVPEVYNGMLGKPVGFKGGSAGSEEAMGKVKVEESVEAQPYVPYVHKENEGEREDFLARAREEATKWAIERAEAGR